MKPIRFTVSATLIFLIPTMGFAIPLDITPNGSFERDRNRDGVPDGWIPALFDSPGTAEWVQGEAHSGMHSVRIADSAHPEDTSWKANTSRWVLQSRTQIQGGDQVSAEVWIKTQLSKGEACVTLAWFSDTKWLHEDTSEKISGEKDWTRCTVSAKAPGGATQLSVYCMLNRGSGSAWFDDVKAVRGSKPAGNFRPINLRSACNVGFRDEAPGDGKGGWTDQGTNDLRFISTGKQVLRGIPFDIIDPDSNAGKGAIVLAGKGRKDVPAAIRFTVDLSCDVLYFLHACAWAGRQGTAAATYLVTYADGETREIPIRNGQEITDWWAPEDKENCARGWLGHNSQSNSIGLGIFPWRNPHPEKTIMTIEAATSGTGPNLMLVGVTAGDGEPSFPEIPLNYHFTNTSDWYEWNFPIDNPELGELDLSYLLDAPAGKHGFSQVGKHGNIVFQDGTRGRFFGTNVGGSRCCPDKKDAEIWAARLVAYGVNLLRLHSYDSRWSQLIDYGKGNSRSLNPDAFDRMDYFVAELKKRGIYVYFDLLDYRSFLPGDDVRDADKMGTRWEYSLKGASIFNRQLIELQKEFATQLLTHKNPYTGLRYVDEPALLIQEITNENSLFYLANTRLMLPSYVAELTGLWNQWLLKRFHNREGLAHAWTLPDGQCVLEEGETPENGTVVFPAQHLYLAPDQAGNDPIKSPVRLNAMTRFLYELEVQYYDEITGHLRGLGLKCLITGTNQDFSDASNRANAFCQAMTRNNYWCHPNVHAKPFNRFRNLSVLNGQISSSATPIANIASSTVTGKPIISPEFNFPWPNEFRGECLPMMMSYASLQEWDGMLFFAYETRTDRRRISYFGNTSDPARWGQVPMAALMFHRGDIAPARNTVHIGVSDVDTFATRPRRTYDEYSPYCVIPYISKLRNAYFSTKYTGDADIVMSSGHSASGDYSEGRHAIVFADSPAVNEEGTKFDRGLSTRALCPGLTTRQAKNGWTALNPETLPDDARVIMEGDVPVGFTTERYFGIPSASKLQPKDRGVWLHRHFLEALTYWNLPGASSLDEAGNVFRSDTGELILDSRRRLFTAVSPCTRIAVGFFGNDQIELGDVSLRCRTPFAAISIIVLDDAKELASASRLLVTAVARAENTAQATIETKQADVGIDADTGAFLPQSTIAIAEFGRPPVLVEPVDATIRLCSKATRAFALNETGQKTRELPLDHQSESKFLTTLGAKSPWILLEN